MANALNQNMLEQGTDFQKFNSSLSNSLNIYDPNFNSNIISSLNLNNNNDNISKSYTETENNFNKLLSKYSNLQNKIMQESLNGNINQNDILTLNQINTELVSLSNDLNHKLEELQNTDNDLNNKINSQNNLLHKYHKKLTNSNNLYNKYAPSLNALEGEVDSSYGYYRYSYAWYLVWLILAIIIFYLIFSISAYGFSASNGLLIVVIALLSLYFIKKFIDYARWSWNFKIPSWKPDIKFDTPKVVFRQYIPQ